MASYYKRATYSDPRYTFRQRNLKHRNSRIRLRYELLEPRTLLAAELGETSDPNSGAITWFESFSTVERIPLASLASVDRTLPANVAGPVASSVGEWIVHLKDTAIHSLRSLRTADA